MNGKLKDQKKVLTCMEVSVNGKKLCTAGIDEGVLTACLTWQMGRTMADGTRVRYRRTDLRVGGLVVNPGDQSDREFIDWINRNVKVGDTITIRVVRSKRWHEPVKRKRPDPEAEQKEKKRYYERLKKEFEP